MKMVLLGLYKGGSDADGEGGTKELKWIVI